MAVTAVEAAHLQLCARERTEPRSNASASATRPRAGVRPCGGGSVAFAAAGPAAGRTAWRRRASGVDHGVTERSKTKSASGKREARPRSVLNTTNLFSDDAAEHWQLDMVRATGAGRTG